MKSFWFTEKFLVYCVKWWDLFVITVVTGRREFLGISILSLLSIPSSGFPSPLHGSPEHGDADTARSAAG